MPSFNNKYLRLQIVLRLAICGGYKEKLQFSSQLEASVNSSRKVLCDIMTLLVP